MPAQLRHRRQAWLVLIASTLAFTVCFMVWMMFGVISIPIGRVLQLNATQVGLMMALPILTGSLVRMPLGLWAFQGEYQVNIPAVLAAVVLSTLPILLLYIVGRRQLLSGLTAGIGK